MAAAELARPLIKVDIRRKNARKTALQPVFQVDLAPRDGTLIILTKIVRDAALGISQGDENRPLAQFAHLRFKAWLEALGLGIVAAPTLRAHSLVVVEQLAVRHPVGVHEQAQ